MAESSNRPVRLAVFGANGQVGWELRRSLLPLGEVIAFDRDGAPLDDLERLRATLDRLDVDVLVNAAAYTAVDKAESDSDLAYRVNATAVSMMAAWAKARGALLVHYSTDYVFDGTGDHFRTECAEVAPLSVYGTTKLAGERALSESGCTYICFRTSWVYAARGGNFAKTMLRLGQERETLSVVGDQWGAPTGADLIADVTAHAVHRWILAGISRIPPSSTLNSAGDFENSSENCAAPQSQLGGVFHLVAAGATNWHAYACLVLEQARQAGVPIKVTADMIHAIPSSAYPTPARRPLNSRLSACRLEKTFGLRMPDWRTGVRRLVAQLT